MEEGSERVPGTDGDDDSAGARVEREREGDVVRSEAVEEKEAEDEGTRGGGGDYAEVGVGGGAGGEVAGGEEDGVLLVKRREVTKLPPVARNAPR